MNPLNYSRSIQGRTLLAQKDASLVPGVRTKPQSTLRVAGSEEASILFRRVTAALRMAIRMDDSVGGTADPEIQADNIRAAGAAPAAVLMEESKIYQVTDKLVETFQRGVLPVDRRDGSSGSLTENTGGSMLEGSNAVGVVAGDSQDQLLNSTKQMLETQMSFNLQYLQLQSQMQNENRHYTAISNIMRTKHDIVKNSLPNTR